MGMWKFRHCSFAQLCYMHGHVGDMLTSWPIIDLNMVLTHYSDPRTGAVLRLVKLVSSTEFEACRCDIAFVYRTTMFGAQFKTTYKIFINQNRDE